MTKASTAEVGPCEWTTINGRLRCTTHQQLGQRAGLGKLYWISAAGGRQLVRAPDPATAKAAVPDAESIERAQPDAADGGADVIDTRELVHRAQPRRRAVPPVDPPVVVECCASGWESLDGGAPPRRAAWKRALALVQDLRRLSGRHPTRVD